MGRLKTRSVTSDGTDNRCLLVRRLCSIASLKFFYAATVKVWRTWIMVVQCADVLALTLALPAGTAVVIQ